MPPAFPAARVWGKPTPLPPRCSSGSVGSSSVDCVEPEHDAMSGARKQANGAGDDSHLTDSSFRFVPSRSFAVCPDQVPGCPGASFVLDCSFRGAVSGAPCWLTTTKTPVAAGVKHFFATHRVVRRIVSFSSETQELSTGCPPLSPQADDVNQRASWSISELLGCREHDHRSDHRQKEAARGDVES